MVLPIFESISVGRVFLLLIKRMARLADHLICVQNGQERVSDRDGSGNSVRKNSSVSGRMLCIGRASYFHTKRKEDICG